MRPPNSMSYQCPAGVLVPFPHWVRGTECTVQCQSGYYSITDLKCTGPNTWNTDSLECKGEVGAGPVGQMLQGW